MWIRRFRSSSIGTNRQSRVDTAHHFVFQNVAWARFTILCFRTLRGHGPPFRVSKRCVGTVYHSVFQNVGWAPPSISFEALITNHNPYFIKDRPSSLPCIDFRLLGVVKRAAISRKPAS